MITMNKYNKRKPSYNFVILCYPLLFLLFLLLLKNKYCVITMLTDRIL